MNYRFHPQAEAELYEAQDWYEERRAGLGFEFLTAVSHAIDHIMANPSAYGRWPGSSLDVHRFVLSRFPYAIAYLVDDGVVELLAIAHTSRRPLYWANRLD